MRRGLLSILGLSTVFFICSGPALACVCGGESHKLGSVEIKAAIAKEFNESAMVFSGEVIAQDTFEVKFRVFTIWKGDAFQEITMSTGAEKVSENTHRVWSCDYRFSVGEKYLVYPRIGADGKLVAKYCTRTNNLASVSSDIPELDMLNPSPYQAPSSDPLGGLDPFSGVARNRTTCCSGARDSMVLKKFRCGAGWMLIARAR